MLCQPPMLQFHYNNNERSKQMTLKNITPEPVFFDDEDDCGDYYSREGCDLTGCDSPVSSYLVELNTKELSICHYHYHTLKETN